MLTRLKTAPASPPSSPGKMIGQTHSDEIRFARKRSEIRFVRKKQPALLSAKKRLMVVKTSQPCFEVISHQSETDGEKA